MKSYTDIEQSKVLATILPLESADMYWSFGDIKFMDNDYDPNVVQHIPCWSLAALEYLIWNTSVDAVSCPHIYKNRIENGYYILHGNYETNTRPSIVDACCEMIEKLHEQNLL